MHFLNSIFSLTLFMFAGLEDEIPEVIEQFEENKSNATVSCSKLPGSVWLHSKRAQVLNTFNRTFSISFVQMVTPKKSR